MARIWSAATPDSRRDKGSYLRIHESRPVRRWLLIGLFVALTALASGCSTTTDEETLSARPWNHPYHWEHGLPAGIMEGR